MWRWRQQHCRFVHSVASLITFLPHLICSYHQLTEIYRLHLQRISTLRSDKKYVPLSFTSTLHLDKVLLHVVKESYRHHRSYCIYHIEEFWAFDWNEVDSCFISHSFSKQRFATAWWTTKQYTWRSRNSQLSKLFRIPYRSLESKQNHHIPITKLQWNINSTIVRTGKRKLIYSFTAASYNSMEKRSFLSS